MYYLNRLIQFDTVEDGMKNLYNAVALRDSMIGTLYKKAVANDCEEIAQKVLSLAKDQKKEYELARLRNKITSLLQYPLIEPTIV